MPKKYGSPNMSDTTILISVEDLINRAMGPTHVNVVNFKMIQTVLHILARQLRMLETQVEIRVQEAPPPREKKAKKAKKTQISSPESSSPRVESPQKPPMKGVKEEKVKPSRDRDKETPAKDKEEKVKEREEKIKGKETDKAEKERLKAEEADQKAERAASKEREKEERAAMKDKEKAERAESRDREKSSKLGIKEREAAERAEAKERDKQLQAAIKIKEKTERDESRTREKQMRDESKEREKAEKAAAKEQEKADRTESKERDKAERGRARSTKAEMKEKEKAERADSKDKEKAERAESKERDKAERSAQKEKEKIEKMDTKEKEKALKEQEKLAKMDAKEREKAEKQKEKLDKMDAKETEKTLKEQEKLAKMDAKEREKAEKEQEKLAKMNSKDRERAEKEKDKLGKMSAKEKEKAEKEREKIEKIEAKEKEKIEKMSAKERKEYEKEKGKEEKERAKSGQTGVSIKEKDKVLIVEKGPTTRTDSRTKLGSIEVVTLSQFELLEAAVKDLKSKAGPLPFPALPDNEKLRRQLSEGSASLTETMQAMQVGARVQAAELAIGRMAGLLTQLAAAGALPQDVAGKLDDVKAEMNAVVEESARARQAAEGPPRKSVAIDPLSKKASVTSKIEPKQSTVAGRPSISSRPSATSRVSIGGSGVSHAELDNAIRALKEDLTKNVNQSTAKATAAAETAAATAKAVSDKLDIALQLNTRINSLYSLVTDYAEQLSGFDAGLTTQMQSFQEQMAQMRNDLKGGVTLLESANNNAETAAVSELTERYEGLVSELDSTLHAHQALTAFQRQLAEELHTLLECVEMLREQKSDRDEVQDGLRDKADNSRLAGLLTEAEFATARSELERRLDLCYDKFRKQEQVWMGAISDLTTVAEGKAEIMQLLAARDDAQQQLRDVQERLKQLAAILGEPKAAMLTRELSRGARCGACLAPALQEPTDAGAGQPPLLPAARPRPAPQDQPCVPEWMPPHPPDGREHACHRWVGGSHTRLESTTREPAAPLQARHPPTKRFTGYGSDGRLYMMEEELQPCVECNMISTDSEKLPEEKTEAVPSADGAGDTGLNQANVELTG